MSYQNIQQLLAQLASENFIDEKNIPEMLSVSQNGQREQTVYVQLLTIFTAWLSSLFLLIFSYLFIGEFLLDSEIGIVVLGITFMLPALLRNGRPSSLFIEQIQLILIIAGQLLVVMGILFLIYRWIRIYDFAESYMESIVCLIAITIMVFTFIFYTNKAHRFLATIGITGAIVILLSQLGLIHNGIHLLLLVVVAATVYLWWQRPYWLSNQRTASFLEPVSNALPYILFTLLMPYFGTRGVSIIVITDLWWPTTIILVVALLIVTILLFHEHGYQITQPAALATIFGLILLVFPAWETPGIVGGLLIFLLAYWRKSNGFLTLASLYFLVNIIAYYYMLNITLLVKSFVLIGSGILFLLGSIITHRLISNA